MQLLMLIIINTVVRRGVVTFLRREQYADNVTTRWHTANEVEYFLQWTTVPQQTRLPVRCRRTRSCDSPVAAADDEAGRTHVYRERTAH